MSDRTSHRRRARQDRTKQARAGIVVDSTPVRPVDPTLEWDRAGMGPCEKCHGVEAETRFGDLLVCGTCRAEFPVLQPWRICPESGEYLDTRTGKPFVFDDELLDVENVCATPNCNRTPDPAREHKGGLPACKYHGGIAGRNTRHLRVVR